MCGELRARYDVRQIIQTIASGVENDIDQIYVGIRKKSRTSKLILGSTAQFIILKAGCPVTSVK